MKLLLFAEVTLSDWLILNGHVQLLSNCFCLCRLAVIGRSGGMECVVVLCLLSGKW